MHIALVPTTLELHGGLVRDTGFGGISKFEETRSWMSRPGVTKKECGQYPQCGDLECLGIQCGHPVCLDIQSVAIHCVFGDPECESVCVCVCVCGCTLGLGEWVGWGWEMGRR